MRQVPETNAKYLVVGNGRLAMHLTHYLGLLQIPFTQYSRSSPRPFSTYLQDCNHVLVLISDRAIVNFIEQHKTQAPEQVVWVHCSGALQTDLAESAHPLASFSNRLFEDEFYKTIPFAVEKGGRTFEEILPGFPNPYYEINKEEKERYHAMCVLAGNFSTILWMEFEKYLAHDLHAPKAFMLPFLQSITHNLRYSANPLTGPLVRNDDTTIHRNLDALNDEALNELYKAFVIFYSKRNSHEKHP